MKNFEMRILAVKCLRILKKFYTYQNLSERLGFSSTEMSRYINFKVIPSEKNAKKILDFFNTFINIEELIKKSITVDKNGFINNLNLLYNLDMLKLISIKAVELYKDEKIDKILTAAVDGIPLATVMASLLNVDIVYAKKSRELGVNEFIEEVFIPRDSSIISYYIPKGSIKVGERILLVDDILRTGDTQRVLLNLVYRARAKPIGIFVIVAIGNEWERVFKDRIPVKYLAKL